MSTKFDELPQETKDLTREVIKASNVLGTPWKASPEEPYALRRFDPNRSEDTQRYKDIDRHPESLQWMLPSKPSSNEDLDWLTRIDETDKEDPRILWAVVDENNEPVGWVQFYKDDRMDPKRMGELNMPENALVLEFSYSKLFVDWPKFSRFTKDRTNLPDTQSIGVAVNGVKQSLILLRQMENLMAQSSTESPRPIYITAYTESENVPSEKALIVNGFQSMGIADYDGKTNNFWLKKI